MRTIFQHFVVHVHEIEVELALTRSLGPEIGAVRFHPFTTDGADY